MRKHILIVDDEPAICSALTLALEDQYAVTAATSPLEGLRILESESIDLCLLDLRIGECDGIALLQQIREHDKSVAVVMMTAYGSIHSAVIAMKMGAFSYITKPLDMEELGVVIEQALDYRELNERVEYLAREIDRRHEYRGMVGRSPAMKSVFSLVEKLKDVDTTVLIAGESGTGKELVAKALHFSGRRKSRSFAEINCAAIPEGLLESELFGHKKGAFTGALEDREGKIEFADGGSLFLDEIGDMPLALQGKLLRALEQKEVTRIGSNRPIEVDVRIITATNKDLKEMVQQGAFRQDLYFRLNVVEIKVPPLRDRKQDLPLLFRHFLMKYNAELNKRVVGLSRAAERLLLSYDYPGNVRELANIINHAVLFCGSDTVRLEDLPQSLSRAEAGKRVGEHGLFVEDLVGLSLDEVERRVIAATLEQENGHRKQTARVLGISERGLRNKIARHRIEL